MAFTNTAPARQEGVSLAACPNIFDMRQDRRVVPAGLTVAEMVLLVAPDREFCSYAHVMIGPDYVPPEMWHCVRLKDGAYITIRFVPGKGGKNPLATILSIALLAVAPAIGASLGTALGSGLGFMQNGILWNAFGSVSWTTLGTGLVSVVGRLAISAIAPPPRPRLSLGSKSQENPTLFITGAQNQVLPWGKVPYPLGKMRMVPPLGARPYTESVGNDQYLRMLFVWGYGPLSISNLKIGETSVDDFDDIEIETRYGYDSDTALTLFSDSVLQNDLSVAINNSDGYVQRTTEVDAEEISLDLAFLNGLVRLGAETGKKYDTTVQVTVGYSIKDANSWTDTTYTYTNKQQAALVKNIRFIVAKNQYDVRVRRLTADATSELTFDKITWSALRTIRYTAPVAMSGIAMTAVRIKATGQLNGVISQFNGEVQSVLPIYSGGNWSSSAATSNPASLYKAILQGPGNARPLADDRLDLDALATWYTNCATASREHNAVIAGDISVRDVLAQVAACGRAAPAMVDGKWTVVEDKTQTVPVQHFTPRNSWGFSGQRVFPDQLHAFRVKFSNRDNGWNADERIVYDDGYNEGNATKFETLELPGVTSSDQAWKDGRYHIATARLRPETYSFSADVEHIVCTRGDLIKFSHDVPLFGLASARVKSLTTSGSNITDITLDADVTMEGATDYGVRFRKSDGTSLRLDVNTVAGTGPTLTLTTPYAIASGPEVGDLAMFGERNSETVDMIVWAIEPQSDLSAKITCVDAAPDVHTADTGTIPGFSSQVTVPPEFVRPPAPVIASIQSGDEVIIVNPDGSYQPSIVVTLTPPLYQVPVTADVQIQATSENSYHRAVFTENNGQLTITGVEPGEIYNISITYTNPLGISSPATIQSAVTVTGGTTAPDDIGNFSINVQGGNAFLSWDAPTVLNIAYFEIKFNNAVTGATWANSIDLVPRVSRTSTGISVPSQYGTYLIKAIGINGLESTNAALIVNAIPSLLNYNAVATLTENAAFSGARTHVQVVNNSLELTGVSSSGEYVFKNQLDLGGTYTSRLSANLVAQGRDTNTLFDNFSNMDTVEDVDGATDASTWNAQLQMRYTTGDPTLYQNRGGFPFRTGWPRKLGTLARTNLIYRAMQPGATNVEDNPMVAAFSAWFFPQQTATWGAWQNFVIGDYTARGYQFRVLLSSTVSGVTPSISTLQAVIDMPDQVQGANNLSGLLTDSNGTQVTFAKTFKAIPAIALAAQDMATGDYPLITGQASNGFLIKFFNAGGSRVTRTFDYVAKGYGLQQ